MRNKDSTLLPDYYFRQLDDNEQKEFRQWARDNYQPGTLVSGLWHPIVQNECHKMNMESKQK